jgi:NADPH:quinone reductase-like Zn-dependent oxidoreductase
VARQARRRADDHILLHSIFRPRLERLPGQTRGLPIRELGTAQVIDYRAVRFEDHVRDMDLVFDTVGGDTLQRSWSVLKPGGRMITIAAESENAPDDRVQQGFFIVEPHHEQLTRIADLLEAGTLLPVVDAVLPLTRASAAYTGEVGQRLGRGKLVVAVAPARDR